MDRRLELIYLELQILKKERVINMLWTIAVILLALWVLGMLTSFTLGGFIHVLIVVAVIVVIVNLLRRRG